MLDTGVLLDRAALLLAQGRIRDAETTAREVLSKEPYNDLALSLLGRCAYEGGHFKDGMGFISDALALRPENSFYYYLLAFGYYQLEEYPAANDHLETAQSLHPDIAEFFGLQAFVLLAQKVWEAALQKADEGLALEADNLTCLNARSRALNKLRRTGEAIDAMQNALAVDPHHELTHTTLAWNYLEKGWHKNAQHHFREALRLSPNSEGARTGLKEALKSNVAPYRWLLQYHFWLHHKGKKWRVAVPVLLYVIFRVLSGALSVSESTRGLMWIPAGVYLLLVVASWSVGPIANCVLLFHPLGRHAVTASERWSALSVVSALCSGLCLLTLALLTPLWAGTAYETSLFLSAITLITLALPLGEMAFPVKWRGSLRRSKAALVLTAAGLLAILVMFLIPDNRILFGGYGFLFILYNWTGIFR